MFLKILSLTMITLSQCYSKNESFPLDSGKTNKFYNDRMTIGNRMSPIPQINFLGKGMFPPSIIQCNIKGSNSIDFQCECKAELDSINKFDKTPVSCRVEYKLDYQTKKNNYLNYFIVDCIILSMICLYIKNSNNLKTRFSEDLVASNFNFRTNFRNNFRRGPSTRNVFDRRNYI